jgi:hypothetical protein
MGLGVLRRPEYRKAYAEAFAVAIIRPRDPEIVPELLAKIEAATLPYGISAPADPDLRLSEV